MRTLVLAVLITIAFISLANAQKPCPSLAVEKRTKVVSDMKRWAGEAAFVGCRAYPNATPDIDCDLSQKFVLNSNISPSYLGTPWETIVRCFPELSDVKALNARAKLQQDIRSREERIRSADAAAKRAAMDDSPKHLLARTYYEYVSVRKCYDERKGYAAVNISDYELDRARRAAKAIEQVLVGREPTLEKDAIWKEINSGELSWKTETDDAELTLLESYDANLKFTSDSRNRCQNLFGSLESRSKKIVPNKNIIEKDF